MHSETATHIVRSTLFDGTLMRIGHVVARPSSPECSELEQQSSNVLVFPTTGVFAKHDGPRRQVIATSNHAVFISAGSPYRVSFPACIGDQCLTLHFSSAALARVAPQAMLRDGFDASAYATRALLTPSVMLERSVLLRRLTRGEVDPLEAEELGLGLLASALSAADKSGNRGLRRSSERRSRQVERVKEAIATCPEQKWALSDLADLACVSPFHLTRVFRDEVGASIYGYVLRARLGKALSAVLDSDSDLTDIALDTGFASHSHFTARFRELFGLTPNDLRRRAGTTLRSQEVGQLRKIVTARATATA
jgi:AraC family transcriptional regulator